MAVFPDPSTDFGARVRQRLRDDLVVWMSTVSADGTPQPNPVWFVVDGDEFIVYTRTDAMRLKHLARNPRVSLNFESDRIGDEVIVMTGVARVVPELPPCNELPAYQQKYGARAAAISGSEAAFAAEYSVAIKIRIERVRGFLDETG